MSQRIKQGKIQKYFEMNENEKHTTIYVMELTQCLKGNVQL